MPLHPNQNFLNQYFADTWSGDIASYQYSGFAILNHIGLNDRVIDVGCGSNPFKGKIKNLTGIDPANTRADVMVAIEDYETDAKFDVALCLGSINFGSHEVIEAQIAKVVSLLTPVGKIFWRCNPGRHDHKNELCEQIDFYPWTFELLDDYARQFGFRVVKSCWDSSNRNERIYSEWQRIFSE